MSTKSKLLTLISFIALAAVMLMVGVWALKIVNFTVGGNLSYIAPGAEATISKGTLSNGVWVNSADASTKMPLTQITTADSEETLSTKFSYWQNLNINFNEAGDDVTIEFSITNDMAKYLLVINVTTSYSSADNATISINTSSAEIIPDASQEFVITMKVTDKTANATLSAFSVVFNMSMAKYVPLIPAEEVSYLTFTYDDTKMEAQLKSCDKSVTSVEIPARILYNQKEYTVTSMYSHKQLPLYGVFYNCPSLTSVIIPDTVTNIGLGAFYNCTSLTKVVIGEGVTSIDWHAFAYCSSLTSITIPDEITSIGDCLFLNSGITSISIPDKVTSIGHSSFAGCAGLTSITIPSSVTSISSSAFSGCTGLTSITIPASVTSIGTNPFQSCSGLETIKVESGNSVYNSNNNCNAIIETSTNALITGCKNTVIPSDVTSIGDSAFDGCTGLTSITIPASVTSIGGSAFYGCTGLAQMTCNATTPPTLGSDVFYGCSFTLTIPSGTASTYKASDWGDYMTE